MKQTIKLIVTLIIVAGIIAGTAWWLYYKSTLPVVSTTSTPTVSVESAKQQTWQQKIITPGILIARQGTTLKNQVSGVIVKLDIHSGEFVKKGALLLSLNHTTEAGALTEAKANYKLSQITYERNKTLGIDVAQQDLDTYKNDVLVDKGQMEQAQGELDERFITAPFSGKLGIRQVNLGDYIDSGTTIVNLQAKPLYVDFYIPQQYTNIIKVGDTINLSADTSDDTSYTGKVTSTDSLINTDTSNLYVQATTNNPKNLLMPGAYVSVTVLTGQPKTVVTVPQMAILYDSAGNYVYTVSNNTATKTTVTLGEEMNDDIIITSGLKKDTQVISAGTNKIKDGTKISIADED